MLTICCRFPSIANHQANVDDTNVFWSLRPRDIMGAYVVLNHDLSGISRWGYENSLLINPAKTALLVIGVPRLLRT